MVQVSNPARDIARLRTRLAVALALVTLCFCVLIARLSWLQIIRHEQYSAQAEDNRIALVPVPAARGLIYDRNGALLADNVSAYTVEITPNQVENLERTIDDVASVIEIGARERKRFRRLLEDSRNFDSIPLKTRLTEEEVARLAAQRYRLRGVEIRARQFRTYPLGETAAHVLGYIGRISQDDKRRLEESDLARVYAGATHIGKIGLEQSYEQVLHGQPGSEEVEVSAAGRVVRQLRRYPSTPGGNLILGIDLKLQQLAEQLYGNRRGALVAIDPKTGEILAFVSKPTFDPNLFVDGIDPQAWTALNEDPDTPLLNRPLRGTYPPGSTYKPFMALAVLQSGVRAPTFAISDPGYYQLGGHRFRDSRPEGNGSVDLRKSIVVSSDTYFYGAAVEMGVDRIHDFMKPWGFGQTTGIDLYNEATGVLPSSQWKLKRYRQHWLTGETPSIGIGQGYNSFTILQLAHATATLANGGVAIAPHLVKAIEDPVSGTRTPVQGEPQPPIPVKAEHLELVKGAMVDVLRVGTARAAFVGAEYAAAGKTGTAQVIGIKQNEKYDARRISERYRDHSLFMAFAPAEDPRIALAVIVENGGFGAQAAAPIARQMFDYYLLGKLAASGAASTARTQTEEVQTDEAVRDVPETLELETEPSLPKGQP
jgi:penicillin-binding protein 2